MASDDQHSMPRTLLERIGHNFDTTETFLFGFDLTTGQIHSSTKIKVNQTGFVGFGEIVAVEPKSGDVFVGGQVVVSDDNLTHYIQP